MTSVPTVLQFETQEALEDYVEQQLNQQGIEPTVALIDSQGTQTIAYRTAPGGDGYGFQFDNGRDPDTGLLHCCECCECGPTCVFGPGAWTPQFPVWVFEATA